MSTLGVCWTDVFTYLEVMNSKFHYDTSLGDCSNLCVQGSLLGDSRSVFLRYKDHLLSYQFNV